MINWLKELFSRKGDGMRQVDHNRPNEMLPPEDLKDIGGFGSLVVNEIVKDQYDKKESDARHN